MSVCVYTPTGRSHYPPGNVYFLTFSLATIFQRFEKEQAAAGWSSRKLVHVPGGNIVLNSSFIPAVAEANLGYVYLLRKWVCWLS